MRDGVRSACGCVIFLAATAGFALSILLPFMGFGTASGWIAASISVALIAAAAMTLRKYHGQEDLAPDFLAKLTPDRYADANGLCFHVIVATNALGVLEVQLHYQNRFDQPCTGELQFVPNGFFRKGLAEFGATVACGAGEYGVVTIPWPMAGKFAGKKICCTIQARVAYPQGKGKALRFKQGTAISGGRSSLFLRLPASFIPPDGNAVTATTVVWSLGPAFIPAFPVEMSETQ